MSLASGSAAASALVAFRRSPAILTGLARNLANCAEKAR
jgi:hypothetical protein